MARHHDRRFGAFGDVQQMPGMLALFENAILNDATPVVGIEHLERIAYPRIGYIDGASGFRLAILPCAHQHGIDRLADLLTARSGLRVFGVAVLVIAGQCFDTDEFGAHTLLCGGFAMTPAHHSFAHDRSFPFGYSLRILRD